MDASPVVEWLRNLGRGKYEESFTRQEIDLYAFMADLREPLLSHHNTYILYSYEELKTATENFDPKNKICEGSFSSVYKGRLNDGILAAIKVFQLQANQDVWKFENEIARLSRVEQENVVKVYGCCIEGDHRILVCGFLGNNSLAETLLGGQFSNSQFSWRIRSRISIGVARGLEFLHEEVQPHIIHGDINPSSIILDQDFTPKIANFCLQTSVYGGCIRFTGYLDYAPPELVLTGHLGLESDIYSFGILLLDIVSGRRNTNGRLPIEERNIHERARSLYKKGKLVELVDKALQEGDSTTTDEACQYLKIGLLCTQRQPERRPAMSTVLKMLKGELVVDEGQF